MSRFRVLKFLGGVINVLKSSRGRGLNSPPSLFRFSPAADTVRRKSLPPPPPPSVGLELTPKTVAAEREDEEEEAEEQFSPYVIVITANQSFSIREGQREGARF